jgi:hypothetical protein
LLASMTNADWRKGVIEYHAIRGSKKAAMMLT